MPVRRAQLQPPPEVIPSATIAPEDWPAAIADADGAQLIVAGPGTGKTEFVVRRAAHLVNVAGVPGPALLALSFSRRSAGELRDRIELATGGVAVTSGTFHAFSQRLLETYGAQVFGWDTVPRLLTGPEQVALIRGLLDDEDRTSWSVAFRGILSSSTFAEEVTDFLLRVFERGVTSAELSTMAAGRDDWRGLADFLETYRDHLRSEHLLDYGTLQLAALDVLSRPELAVEIGQHYRYVLVDEYQDTTPTQALMVELLSARTGNVTAAADPYQSIYGFRGTDVNNVAEFEDRFAGLTPRRLILAQSFRVPAEILTGAERITAGTPLPGGAGPIIPAPHRGAVDVLVFDQHSEEADWIAEEVQRLRLEEGLAYRSIAVLVRSTRRFLPQLIRSLDRRGIPHDQPGKRLVDHPAVTVVFDLARLAVANSADATVLEVIEGERAASRLLLGPLLGLPLSQQRALVRRHHTAGTPWPTLLASIDETELATLVADAAWCRQEPAAAGLWTIWTQVPGLEKFAHGERWADHRAALASLSQVFERLFERTPGVSLLDYIRLSEEEDFQATPLLASASASASADGDRLTVTTMHQAKGLEFEAVFIADASEGVLPDLRRQRSLLQPEFLAGVAHDRSEKIREEMRLAYTAMTRARSRVVWSATRAGVDELQQRPSRFLLAVAAIPEAELTPPPTVDRPPITALEAERMLRRRLVDPTSRESERLAALAVLVQRPNSQVRDAAAFAGTRRRGSDRGILGDHFSLSPSQGSRYEQCPRRYALERRVGIDTEAGPYAAFGTIIHAALEDAERAAMQDGRRRSTFDEALAIADRLIDETDFGGQAFQEAWKRWAAELLERLYDEWPHPAAEPVLLEHPLDLAIGGIPWHGKADRIEREGDMLRIVDYKTSRSRATVKEAADSIQLGYYLLAARHDETVRAHGIPAEAEFWYPGSTTKSMTVEFDPDRIDDLADHLASITESIANEHWEPIVSDQCDRCAVRLVCPEWPEGREAFVR